MARIAIRLFTSAILLITSVAAAEDIKGFYVRADGGASMPSKNKGNSFKAQPLYSVGAGYHFNDIFRTELNLQYRPIVIKSPQNNFIATQKANNYSAVLNAYLNLSDSEDNVIPYLTAGIGYGKNKLSNSSITKGSSTISQSGSTNNLIWNAGTGITISVIKNLRLDIGYRYYSLGNLKTQTTFSATGQTTTTASPKSKLYANEITAGLIYKF